MSKIVKDKIAIISNSLSLGGAERVSLILAEWMTSTGADTYLYTLNKDREDGYVLNPEINRVAINKESALSKIQLIKELRHSLKKHKINKILVMGVPLAMYVIPAVIGLNISVIVSERNDPSNFKGKKITKFLSRKLMYFADGYIFQTEGAKNYYPDKIKHKATVIPNPLLVDILPEPHHGVRAKRIVTAGRLVPQKNHKLLIKAFKEVEKKFPEYTLTIYGNGSEKTNLEALIKRLDLQEKVFLPGATKKLFEEIIDAKVFVLSSDFEGMPNALIEAMALGIPCISTDCPSGGPKEIIQNMNNGMLVPTNSPEELSKSMIRLLSDDKLSKKISTNSVKIRKTLDKDLVCNKFFKFLTNESTNIKKR